MFIGWYYICVYWYSLTVYLHVLACVVCIRGICMYWSVLVDLLYCALNGMYIDSILYVLLVLMCCLVYLYVLQVSVCIWLYLPPASCESTCSTNSMHIAMFARIDLRYLRVLVCIV